MFDYLGYSAVGTQTTLSFKVTNKCKNGVGYVALGTNGFTRVAPPNGGSYNGGLGSYSVSWTHASGNPGFISVKFENAPNDYKNGAMDIFSIVVTNFNPNTVMLVEGKAGNAKETSTFLLSQTTCPAPSTRSSSDWVEGSWSDLVAWLTRPRANTSPGKSSADAAANWPVTDAAATGRQAPDSDR